MALTGINLALLLLVLAPPGSTSPAPTVAPILRGRAPELVDDRGLVRSRLHVEADGEVVLRLFDRHGTVRVKLGAGEDGSGLLLLDGAAAPGVHMVARRMGPADRPTATSITLTGADGQRRVIAP